MATDDENNGLSARMLEAFEVRSLKEVATKLGQKYSSFHNWVAGRRDFPIEVLKQIAKMTNISLNWLLTGEGEKYSVPRPPADPAEIVREGIRGMIREAIRERVVAEAYDQDRTVIREIVQEETADIRRTLTLPIHVGTKEKKEKTKKTA